jgi:4,5-DOPA dioxygenase extradiol
MTDNAAWIKLVYYIYRFDRNSQSSFRRNKPMAEIEKNDGAAQIVYFSHGGGPLPILGDPGHRSMVRFMEALPAKLRKPDAILVISAHWEAHEVTLTGGESPPLIYDYYGFPEEAYDITYPAPGQPGLVELIAGLLQKSGIPSRVDKNRGFDHGMFIPLKLMYPDALIPTVQMSLLHSLDPSSHLKLGRALRPLLEKNILVIGSGFSFHNLGAFSWRGEAATDTKNDAFQNWLIDLCTGNLSESDREHSLEYWEEAPSARYCHPREEHLLPLHVCAGMANRPARVIFDDFILGKRAVAFQW